MEKPIVVIGSSNTDMIIRTSRLPQAGETILGGEFLIAPGGKGANQAVSAARAGGNVIFIARIGTDTFGEYAINGLQKDGIVTGHIIRDVKTNSGIAFIIVDEIGRNTIIVASGSNANLSPSDIQSKESIIASARILLLQLEIPLESVKKAIDIAAKNGVEVILNPAPAQSLCEEILRKVSIITPNEIEAEHITGIKITNEQSASQSADFFLSKGVRTVIITLGEHGVYLASQEYRGFITAYTIEAVDTTAAGDVFNGVLAASLAEGKSLLEAIHYAQSASALSVTQPGAQPSMPYGKDIEAFLDSHVR